MNERGYEYIVHEARGVYPDGSSRVESVEVEFPSGHRVRPDSAGDVVIVFPAHCDARDVSIDPEQLLRFVRREFSRIGT